MPELELGFPWFVYYQPLPALAVVGLHRALLGLVDLLTVFDLVRLVLLAGFPLTVYWSLRRLGVGRFGAAVAAAMSPLLSGDFRYGFEYDSYIWRGFGMFTQLAAMHLSFVAVATLWRALERGGRSVIWAALALSALVLSHLVYSYMMAIIAVVLVVAGAASRRDLARRALRLVTAGVPAALLTAWLTLPFLAGISFLGASQYLQPEKYDSYGAPTILGWLLSGDLLDHGRLPVATALLGLGVVAALATRTPLARTALAGFVVWLVLFFGRPTLGPLVDLLPLHDTLLFHRFVGGVDLFAIVLVGLGAAWAYERAGAPTSPRRFALAAVAAVALMAPAVAERAAFYGWNTTWMTETRDAIAADADARTIVAAIRALPSARVYAGFRRTGFGQQLDFRIPFNSVRFSDYLVFEDLPVVGPPYSSVSLNADLMWDLGETRADQYDVFDARYVVAPTGVAVAPFLRPLVETARYTLYEAPTTGYATYGALAGRLAEPTQRTLFALNRPWFGGGDVAARRFYRLDFPSNTPISDAAVPGCTAPAYSYERAQPGRLDLLVGCPDASTLVLKVTYHPNWHVLVDGAETTAFMVSPSYIGTALPAGQHFVTAEYRPTPMKAPLLLLALATLLALGAIAVGGAPLRVRMPRLRRVAA